MPVRRAPANGKPKLSPLVEAELMLVAASMGMTGSEALNDGATRWIKWARLTAPRQAYASDKADYDAGRSHKSPDPKDYGLPNDHGSPPAFRL